MPANAIEKIEIMKNNLKSVNYNKWHIIKCDTLSSSLLRLLTRHY